MFGLGKRSKEEKEAEQQAYNEEKKRRAQIRKDNKLARAKARGKRKATPKVERLAKGVQGYGKKIYNAIPEMDLEGLTGTTTTKKRRGKKKKKKKKSVADIFF